MQIGIITLDGRTVGTVNMKSDDGFVDVFVPDAEGYVPSGRAERGIAPAGAEGPHAAPARPHGTHHHSGGAKAPGEGAGHSAGGTHRPKGETYTAAPQRAYPQGSGETDQAIVEAARAHNLDPNYMRSIASIESGMNPNSNANRSTQYKGLYQIGHDEWRRVGNDGNIYSARENAMGAGRLFDLNRNQFKQHFGREPTETEMYMMHQQGLGFYTRGAMTNIGGNPYPGMRGPQTHESFEAGWGREIARRKAAYASRNPGPEASANPARKMTDENAP